MAGWTKPMEWARTAGGGAIARLRPGRMRTRLYAILGMVTWKVGKRYARRRIGRMRPQRVSLRPPRHSA